jgi:hypothetical protein
MPPIGKIKITESGFNSLGANPKPAVDIYPVYPSTTL